MFGTNYTVITNVFFLQLLQAFEVIITKLEPPPDHNPSPENTEEEQTEIKNDEPDEDLQNIVPEIPQWATEEDTSPGEDVNLKDVQEQDVVPEPAEEPVHVEVEPEKEVEDEPVPKEVPQKTEAETPKPQTHQVKFSESLILTSFKSPPPKEEKKEQVIKPILKPAVSKAESPTAKHEEKVAPATQKRVTPVLERKVADRPPLVKPPPVVPVQVAEKVQTEEKDEQKKPEEEARMAEERAPPKLEPEV